MAELLLGDDPPPPEGRPRWVDAAGLGAVIALILAIGILGDRGSKDDPAPPTTTTSTTTTAPATGPRPRPAPDTPGVVEDLGPMLAAPTGTSLLLLGPSTRRMLDLDTGAVRDVAGVSGFDAVGLRGGFLLIDSHGIGLLPADGSPAVAFDAESRRLGGRVSSSDPDRVWLADESDDGGLLAREHRADGQPTGRHLSLPRTVSIEGAVDDGLIVSQAGSLTYVDADGRGHDLGPGTVVATHGHLVARIACAELRCRLELVDLRTGRSTPIDGLGPVAQGSGTFSPDGRWLAASFASGNERAFLVVIDVVEHRTGPGILDGDAFAFADPDTLVVVGDHRLRAYDLPAADRHVLPGADFDGVTSLVAAPTR